MTRLHTNTPARCDAEQSRPKGILSRIRQRTVGFKRDEQGAAMLEFAIVSTPFLLIIFATLEVGIHYFAERAMQKGVERVARQLRTGEMPPSSTINDFRDALCDEAENGILTLFDCSKFAIDVQEVGGFFSPTTPLDENGELKTSELVFSPAGAGQVNMVRVFYEWPAFLNWAKFDAANEAMNVPRWSGDDRLFTAVSMFRNEPFPDT